MESLSSRNLHRKLSNSTNGFSARNAYDGVFSAPPKFRAPNLSSPVEDYKEIFGNSRASSIPILDLSSGDDMNDSADFRSSNLDYSDIFGGFRYEHIGVSYEDLVAGRRREKISSSGKLRTPSSAEFPVHGSDLSKFSKENQVLKSEVSYQSFDDVKKFNMSYHKTSQKNKDGTNGTTHVAQFHPIPGFTCFVDEPTSPQKTHADKQKPPVVTDIRSEVDLSEGIMDSKSVNKNSSHFSNKQTFKSGVKSRSGFSWDGSYSNDKIFNAYDINLKSHPSKVRLPSRLPSSVPASLGNSNGRSKRSVSSTFESFKNDASEHAEGELSPPFFGEELDVNSAAAASAAVLKEAIEKAQESIRIAKELMEKKKEGLRNRTSRGSLKVKDRRENVIAREDNRTEDKNVKDTCETVDFLSQNFAGMGMKTTSSGEAVSDFKDNDEAFFDGQNINESHKKDTGATEENEPATWFSRLIKLGKSITAISGVEQVDNRNKIGKSLDAHEGKIKEMNVIEETLEPEEVIISKEKADAKVHDLEEMERIPIAVKMIKESEGNVDKLESAFVVHEHEEVVKSGLCQQNEAIKEKQTSFYKFENCEESQQTIEDGKKFESQELKYNDYEKKLEETQKLVEDENEQQDFPQQEHIEKITEDVENEEDKYGEEVNEDRFEDAVPWIENENEQKEVWGSDSNEKKENIHIGADSGSKLNKVQELEIDEKRLNDAPDGKESERGVEEFEWEGNEKDVAGSYIYEETENLSRETDQSEKIEVPQVASYENNFNRASNASENTSDADQEAFQHNYDRNSETSQEVGDNDGNMSEDTKNFNEYEMGDTEVVNLAHKVELNEIFRTYALVQDAAEENEYGHKMEDIFEDLLPEDNEPTSGLTDRDFDQKEVEHKDKEIESETNLDNGIEILANGSSENVHVLVEEITYDEEARNTSPETSYWEWQQAESLQELEAPQVPCASIEVDDEIRTSQYTEKNENVFDTFGIEVKETEIEEEINKSQTKEKYEEKSEVFFMKEKEMLKAVQNKEYLRKFEEANKREREREKDRISVERAIREARERAFAEARERAERAAVERANAEVRQRVMAEARQKLEKATVGTKLTADKTSIEAKRLKAERAAVERVTAEARVRALEKALSQKNTSRAQAERYVTENVSGPPRDNSMKQTFSSSDVQRSDETNTESAHWSKARLERHQKIMERAAKALEEKNMRDLLAQKEQAEKNRLAEALDADIKRWSSGKEGNLRALLSTLQYVLGPGSGWQSISLTDIVTTSAVKKAYRKATLYVHPDKLQQRGASIQQKYICEEVFDLLKAAWNKFNSEER